MLARRLVFPLCLLVGPLLVILAGTLHPDLVGDGAAQLTTIAQCEAWRAIHWTFLFSFPLALTGLVGLARVHAGNPGESAVRAGLNVATIRPARTALSPGFPACTRAKPTSPVSASGKLNRNVQWIARHALHCAMAASWAAPSPARSGCSVPATITSSGPTSRHNGNTRRWATVMGHRG